MEKRDFVENVSEFLNENYENELASALVEGKKSLEIDFSLLEKFDTEMADFFLESPEEALKATEKAALEQIDTGFGEAKLRIRLFNLPKSKEIRIRNVRAEHIGKMIVIDGLVKRSSDIRPEVSEAIFQCPECGNRITIIQSEKILKPPIECEKCDNTKGFRIVDQKLYDARWILVEEPFEITSGERPSDLRVYLKEDLTTPKMQNKTDPGNTIKVVGILKELPVRFKGTMSRQMDIYLDANYVESVETEWEEVDITKEDEDRIIEIAKSPEVYEKLKMSIAPALYGLEHIKEAIVLQLFGGEIHIQKDRSRVRGDIHILLVGDPSTAKSAIMKVVSMLIPRGRYVSGKGVTAAGLTASVIRDEEFLGGWILEAGALVLCDRSLCAIDEFEKVEKSDQIALHEAMEQQTISIAKANIVATLPSRTSILGGGNPKLGRFDPYLPIKEQIDVPETILARFDLKFALRDIPDPVTDAKMMDHILKARHFETDQIKPELEPEFLKKYVAYARKNCHPDLSREAGHEIKKFFVELRTRVAGEEAPIPITFRQSEALIRLAEASAKIQLRKTVTAEDALRSINLMKASLREFGFEPETGRIDIDRAEGQRVTSAQRSKIRIMMDIIEDIGAVVGKVIPTEEITKKAREEGVENAEEILRKMLNEGMLFSPFPGKVQKI